MAAANQAARFESGPQSIPMQHAALRESDPGVGDPQRLEPAAAAARERLAEVRARLAQAQATLNAVRSERTAHDQLFQRQAGARSAVVGEQRGQLRAHMLAFGRRALDDKENFGEEYAPAREDIARRTRDAEARANAVGLHEAALVAHDKRGVVRGYLVVAAVFALLFLVALFALASPWIRASD
jgi:hypothetical protein